MPTCGTCRKTFDEGTTSCPDDGSVLLPDDLAAASPELAAGTMVGDYRIEAKIGEGAFGVVYSAEHPIIGKRAAIKLLDRKYCADASVVSRFITEARAVNRIRHPNIVDVFAFGRLGEQHFLAMELLEGISLGSLLEQRGHLEPSEALPILRGIAEAIDAAHQAGIVHRDLKPDNVFLVRSPDGGARPKLLDFGVAKLGGDGEVMHKTQTGTAVGTPLYMSPEQCRGKGVSGASDVYALGAVAFQVLAGRPPFDGESVMDVLMAHIAETAPPISSVRPSLGTGLDATIASMLAKRPDARPATATAAIASLTEAAHVVERAPALPAAPSTMRTLGAAEVTVAESGLMLSTGTRPTLVSGEPTGEPTGEPRPTILEEARRLRAAADAQKTQASPGARPHLGGETPELAARATTGGKGETMDAITAPSTPPRRTTSRWVSLGLGVAILGAGVAWALRPEAPAPPALDPRAEPRAAAPEAAPAPGSTESPALSGGPRPVVSPSDHQTTASASASARAEPPPAPPATGPTSPTSSTPPRVPKGPLPSPAPPGVGLPATPSSKAPGPGVLDARD